MVTSMHNRVVVLVVPATPQTEKIMIVTDQTYEDIRAKLDLLQAFTDKCGLATTESVTVTDNVVSATNVLPKH